MRVREREVGTLDMINELMFSTHLPLQLFAIPSGWLVNRFERCSTAYELMRRASVS